MLSDLGNEVEWISYNENSFTLKLFRKLYRLLCGKGGSFTHSRLSSWGKVRTISTDLNKFDVIFIPGQVDVVAGLKTKTPIVYYTDGTVPLMINYYWFNFTKRAIEEAKKVELIAKNNTQISIYASSWARNSAINDYGVSKKSSYVLPFGANLTTNDLAEVSEKNNTNNKKNFNIIFSGVDWKRKGGQIAVDAVEKLNIDGYNATLTVCGARDINDNIKELPFVNYLGFLNKENEKEYRLYLNAWKNADVMILPTRAECAGIVFNEASAFGVPTLTTDTGGVANYVKNGVNGYRLSLSATGIEYAKKLEDIITGNELPILSENAKELYRESNSWSAWGKKMNKILSQNIRSNS